MQHAGRTTEEMNVSALLLAWLIDRGTPEERFGRTALQAVNHLEIYYHRTLDIIRGYLILVNSNGIEGNRDYLTPDLVVQLRTPEAFDLVHDWCLKRDWPIMVFEEDTVWTQRTLTPSQEKKWWESVGVSL